MHELIKRCFLGKLTIQKCIRLLFIIVVFASVTIKGCLIISEKTAPQTCYLLNDFQQSVNIDSVYFFNHGKQKDCTDSNFVVVTWNIQQGRNLEKQISYLEALQPEIICLQEVDWNNKRTNYLNIIETFSKKLKMNACYGIEFLEIESERRKKYNYIGEGGGVTGNAILTRSAQFDCQKLPLTKKYFDWENPGKFDHKIIFREPRLGQRFALICRTNICGQNITIVSTHFEDKGGGITGRVEQINQIFELVKEFSDAPIIIAGDFNTLAHGLALIVLKSANSDYIARSKPWCQHEAEWWDENIISKTIFFDPFDKKEDFTVKRSIFYRGKLDWILLNKLEVIIKGMSTLEYSDHKALWVKLQLN